MSSTITVEFEFDIGDAVFFKGTTHARNFRPRQFIVYERIAQQCHGGIQRLYLLGDYKRQVSETILTKDEPKYQPISDAEMQESVDMILIQEQAHDDAMAERIKKRREKRDN